MIDFDYEALRSIGLNNTIISRLAEAPAGRLYRITEYQRERISLHDGVAEIHARALPRLLAETALCVGDWVIAQANSLNEVWINHRLSPMNQFARADSPPIASNIDTALLVMGLDDDFNLRRIERYLALAAAAEVTPLIVLSKPDLCADIDGRVAALTERLPPRTQFLLVNGTSAESITQLDPWLGPGQTICLLGSSGAGKSTLTNALAGATQETGGVRRTDHRGRHTTTARSMHLPFRRLHHRYAGLAQPEPGILVVGLRRYRITGRRLPVPRLPARGRTRLRSTGPCGPRPPAQLPQAATRSAPQPANCAGTDC